MNKTIKHPWRWNAILFSLRDVKIYLAEGLLRLSHAILECQMLVLNMTNIQLAEKETEIVKALKIIASEASTISLSFTKKFADRLLEKAPKELRSEDFTELMNRFDDEIENIKFFWAAPERLKFYNNTEIAGTEFKEGFPNGNAELIEAGNCLAMARYTACVFHLMRSLEIALTSLERQLGIAVPSKGSQRTWGKTLERISDQIAENNQTPPADWENNKLFYEQVYAILNAIKSPYRDTTMHVQSVYDETGAVSVFNVGVEALRHIATKLAE